MRDADMTATDPEIDDYLSRYAASLTAFDSAAAAELWAMPAMIVDDRFAGVIDDRKAMAQGLQQSYPLYRELGLSSVTYEYLDTQNLTAALEMVHVRWRFLDADGKELTDSTAYYVLRRDDDGVHACVCIQVDDAAKIQALAAERGIELPGLAAP